jgi:hypothetical protein
MKILSFAGKWMELENIILSEGSHPGLESLRPHIFPHMWNTGPIQIQAILYIHRNVYRECS